MRDRARLDDSLPHEMKDVAKRVLRGSEWNRVGGQDRGRSYDFGFHEFWFIFQDAFIDR